MPSFGATSAKKLAECDERLQGLFNDVVKVFDCTVVTGYRGKEDQDAAVAANKSQIMWPNGKHNRKPSLAADVAPYSARFKQPLVGSKTQIIFISKETGRTEAATQQYIREQYSFFAGYVLGRARSMGLVVRWLGDENRNWDTLDNKFDDLMHFELVESR